MVTGILVLFQAAASAPTPLYAVYRRLWGFSVTTLTLVFAVFAFALLGTLLTLGSLSDHVGRRPVLAAAVVLEVVATVLFLTAGSVAALLLARVVQGAATGLAMPTIGATLVDLEPPHARGRASVVNGVVPIAGLALGSLACGALVEYAPAPTRLVWLVLAAVSVLAFVLVLALPESGTRRSGAVAGMVPRLGVPRRLRGDVYPVLPLVVASWALGGLYLSLGPSVAQAVFGVGDHLLGGLTPTLLCGAGAVTALAMRRLSAPAVTRASTTLLAAGMAVTLAGVLTRLTVLAAAGTVTAGVGYGAAALATFGAIATVAGPAEPTERARLFAVAYTVAFLSFSTPALAAGYATTILGLRTTVLGYGCLVVAVVLVVLGVHARGPYNRAVHERGGGGHRGHREP